jgi:hypothetical protein
MSVFFLQFGSGDPSNNSGLSPTFTIFKDSAGNDITPPSIAEISSSGIYSFTFSPTLSIAFVCDGATTGLSSTDRYITGGLDPAIGDTSALIGDSSSDPTSVFGYLKRLQELQEGDEEYTKASGVLERKDRTGATTLVSQTISDSTSNITKT